MDSVDRLKQRQTGGLGVYASDLSSLLGSYTNTLVNSATGDKRHISVASAWETEPGNPWYEARLDYKVKLHLRGTKIGMQLGGRAQALARAHKLAL